MNIFLKDVQYSSRRYRQNIETSDISSRKKKNNIKKTVKQLAKNKSIDRDGLIDDFYKKFRWYFFFFFLQK